MTAYAENMSQKWKEGTTLDIHKEVIKVTSTIISKSVLGSDIKSEEGDLVGNALLICAEYFNHLLIPFGNLVGKIPFLRVNKDFQDAQKRLDSIVYDMIKEHQDNESKAGVTQTDLLYTLLHAHDAEACIGRMSDLQLRDEVMTIFLAGHETTANALGHFIYCRKTQL